MSANSRYGACLGLSSEQLQLPQLLLLWFNRVLFAVCLREISRNLLFNDSTSLFLSLLLLFSSQVYICLLLYHFPVISGCCGGQGGEEVDMLVQSPVLICKSFSEFFFYSIEMHKDLLSRLGVYMLINNSGVLI